MNFEIRKLSVLCHFDVDLRLDIDWKGIFRMD